MSSMEPHPKPLKSLHMIDQMMELQQFALEHVQESVFFVNSDGHFTYVNKSACTYLGYTKEELLEMSVLDIDPQFTTDLWRTHWEDLKKSKHLVITTTQLKKDGTIIPVEINANYFEYNGTGFNMAFAQDISEHQKYQGIILKKEQDFRTLAENSPNIIMRYDMQCHRVYANPAFSKQTGIPPKLATNAQPDTQWHLYLNMITMNASDYQKRIHRVLKTGENTRFVIEWYRLSDGEYVVHDLNVVAERNIDGEVIGALAIGHNITEQKRMQEELVLKEIQFRTIAEHTPDTIARYDRECIRTYANPAFATLAGKSVDELVGKKPTDYYCTPQSMQYEEAILRVFKTGTENEFEYTWPDASGNMLTSLIHIVPEKDPYGTVQTVLATGRNITRLKNIENQLLEQNRFLESLLNAIPVPIFLKDTETRYKAFNKAFEEFYGKNKKDLIGKSVFELFPPEQAQVFFDADAELFHHGGTQIYEAQLRDARGIDHTVMFHKAVYSDETGTTGMIGTILDITERKKQEELLRQKEQNFRTLSDNSPNMIMRYDRECQRIYVNRAYAEQTVIPVEEATNTKPTELWGVHFTDANMSAQEYQDVVQQVIQTAKPAKCTLSWTRLDDQKQVVHDIHIVPEFNNTHVVGALAIGHDITQAKEIECELNKQKDFQETLLKGIAEAGLGVHVTQEGRYIYTNDINLATKYGYDNVAVTKPSFLDAIHPEDRAKVAEMHQRRLRGENVPSTYEVGLLQKDGKRREHEVSVIVIPNTDPQQTLIVTKDITERKTIEKKIEHMAHHDALTGLPNRVLAQDRMERAIAYSDRHNTLSALLFIDLDGFKAINDTLGHTIGDDVLQSVSQRLKECIRESDTISRQGGDEFLLILSEITTIEEIKIVAEKLIHTFDQPIYTQNHTLSVSASIGIAIYPNDGENFETLQQNADTAMYKAKESGKNTYVFYTKQMSHYQVDQFKLQSHLKTAITERAFVLHYQPQIDLTTNRIIGAEALIRWNHPQMGMVSPMSFIPLAESSGLIVPIGQWVIEESCRQAVLWHQQGLLITVAVNISAIQFKRGNLLEVISNALNSSGLNPHYLEVELTESIMMHDVSTTLQAVQALKGLGIQLSIDDFGTGYSSLAYLKRFAVDKLKIDQSFVRDILQDQEDAVIVSTIIQMAKSLNLKTIAEGVESKEVLALIEEFGCDEVQGYYFAKPMESFQFERYYQQYT